VLARDPFEAALSVRWPDLIRHGTGRQQRNRTRCNRWLAPGPEIFADRAYRRRRDAKSNNRSKPRRVITTQRSRASVMVNGQQQARS